MVKQPLCDMMLKEDEVAMLKEAIRQDYFFEFFFDDLPVWGYLSLQLIVCNFPVTLCFSDFMEKFVKSQLLL